MLLALTVYSITHLRLRHRTGSSVSRGSVPLSHWALSARARALLPPAAAAAAAHTGRVHPIKESRPAPVPVPLGARRFFFRSDAPGPAPCVPARDDTHTCIYYTGRFASPSSSCPRYLIALTYFGEGTGGAGRCGLFAEGCCC